MRVLNNLKFVAEIHLILIAFQSASADAAIDAIACTFQTIQENTSNPQ